MEFMRPINSENSNIGTKKKKKKATQNTNVILNPIPTLLYSFSHIFLQLSYMINYH